MNLNTTEKLFYALTEFGMMKLDDELGTKHPIGYRHYRAFVGPPEKYDLIAASQFNLFTSLGLRENHYLLDIGCGSLRGGRLFIPYLLPNHYFGIEPEQWLIDEGIQNEIGLDMVRIKNPAFSNDKNFTLSVFNRKFDFILAQSIFSHASEKQIRRCLSEIKKVMVPSGIFAATFFKGNSNYREDKWAYPESVNYTLEYMTSIIEDYGLSSKPLKWVHPNGQTWMQIVHKDNKNDFADL